MSTIDKPSSQPTIDPPRFNGWLRQPGRRWAIASQADSQREAFALLNSEVKARGPGAYDMLVLPSGQQP